MISHNRFKLFGERYTHKGKLFTNIVCSKEYEDFITKTLSSLPTKVTIIPAGLEGRPDLLSYAVYGTSKYWWVICEANRVVDPFEELYSGRQIHIPTL